MLSTCSRTHFDRSEGSEEELDFQARMILQSGQLGKFLIDPAIPAQKNSGPRLVNLKKTEHFNQREKEMEA